MWFHTFYPIWIGALLLVRDGSPQRRQHIRKTDMGRYNLDLTLLTQLRVKSFPSPSIHDTSMATTTSSSKHIAATAPRTAGMHGASSLRLLLL
jgi:hypothetical protein